MGQVWSDDNTADLFLLSWNSNCYSCVPCVYCSRSICDLNVTLTLMFNTIILNTWGSTWVW